MPDILSPETVTPLSGIAASIGSDFIAFCIYEIDTPTVHLSAENFKMETPTCGPLNPNTPLGGITITAMLTTLDRLAKAHGFTSDDIHGHFTTSDGVCLSASDLLATHQGV